MSPQPADDAPKQVTNGRVRIAGSRPEDALPPDRSRPPASAADHDERQTRSENELTLSDGDQTLSDFDQTSAESDQSSAESDQRASDQDQVASDQDLAAGGSPRTHDSSREVRKHDTLQRQRNTDRRERIAQARLGAARQRDAVADARELAALARDQAAAARDLAMAQFEAANEQEHGPHVITDADVMGDAEQPAARHHAKAVELRGLAAADRLVAARDRAEAARERQEALVDREAMVRELGIAATDALTGARTRAAGLAEFDHELARCRRAGWVLVVVYVDVDGLKSVNDTEGHAAGDELLKRVVALISSHLRSYDLIIRLGGDEFLCAMSNTTTADARERFRQVAAALADTSEPGSIRTGLAELAEDETAAELIARADSQLLAQRRN